MVKITNDQSVKSLMELKDSLMNIGKDSVDLAKVGGEKVQEMINGQQLKPLHKTKLRLPKSPARQKKLNRGY